ncbi:protein translocase subunit SecF [Corynebacterium stationis]|uniref:Protein translocase subunit SecF n=1 Tax=Corynebacterium stationis TaxID=1705 RepID=A0A177IES8_9CORY|nr:protein translocase subunit SecF [Corynebacterium stationis]APT94921.1 preprotein translocase subunit SecF [Corynebacterium stationis]AQX70992.1 protein translocase subunit SecF [Corynebacterium stationis]ASJ18679.1 protein-export membrane protein SecF [Corynebacterium stationis]OAH27340.1 preprotein translocase subunit SecF [Corynebacterium stationis]HHT59803.1 protein translocase subunit SecF [Corynebacterium stationis]
MAANKSKISRMDRLYLDEGGFDFIKRSKTWYSITIGLLVVAIAAIAIRGFSLSLDFEGGTKINLPAKGLEETAVSEVFQEATGIEPEQVQIVGSGESATLEVNSERLTEEQADSARLAIYEEFQPVNAAGEATPDAVGVSTVSESWGSTITKRMIIAMIVFLVIATAYVAFRLQRTMALAAILALIADGIIIAGLYALFGLEVSPAVIIGLLTVLTFSIYDSVIVFDKVNENTEGITGQRNRTYAEQTNLAINQTVMRSISTSVISALPIIALFVVAVWMMGIGTLRDLALIQLIGVIEGIFSSIFLASPLVVTLANRSKKIKEHNKQVAEYRASAEFSEGEQDAGSKQANSKRQVVSPTAQQPTNLEGTQVSQTGSSWRPRR